jgi:hypothetical protein
VLIAGGVAEAVQAMIAFVAELLRQGRRPAFLMVCVGLLD